MKVIYGIVTGMDTHAHAGDVDRVSPYVRLERHCRGCGWMGERRFRGIVGAKELSEIGILLADQVGDYGHHGGGYEPSVRVPRASA